MGLLGGSLGATLQRAADGDVEVQHGAEADALPGENASSVARTVVRSLDDGLEKLSLASSDDDGVSVLLELQVELNLDAEGLSITAEVLRHMGEAGEETRGIV